MAVAAFCLHLSLEITQADAAVAGSQVYFAFPRHVNVNVDPPPTEIEVEVAMRKADLKLHGTPGLVVINLDAVLANFPPLRCYLHIYRVLVPGVDADIGIGSLHSQLRLAADGKGLCPLVSAGEWHG